MFTLNKIWNWLHRTFFENVYGESTSILIKLVSSTVFHSPQKNSLDFYLPKPDRIDEFSKSFVVCLQQVVHGASVFLNKNYFSWIYNDWYLKFQLRGSAFNNMKRKQQIHWRSSNNKIENQDDLKWITLSFCIAAKLISSLVWEDSISEIKHWNLCS